MVIAALEARERWGDEGWRGEGERAEQQAPTVLN